MRHAAIVCGLAVAVGVCLPVHAGLLGVAMDNGNLYSVSTVTGAATVVGNTGVTNWADLAWGLNGVLYGFTTGTTGRLYSINPATAAVTDIGALGGDFVFEGALAIASDGTAFATNMGTTAAPRLFRIDLTTGAATMVANLNGGSRDLNGMVFRSDGVLVGLDRFSNSLVTIDTATGTVGTLASLGFSAGGVGGMTNANGVTYLATAGPAGVAGTNNLYTVDLFTGATSLVGSLGFTFPALGLSGLASNTAPAAVPEPATLSLLLLGALAGWCRSRLHS
jgi:hypothetical protein